MASPGRGSKIGAVVVFGLSALLSWCIAVGVSWIAQRGLQSVGRRGPTAQLLTSPTRSKADEFAERLRKDLLSGQECATAVAGLSPSAIRDLLGTFDSPFWRSNPNAAIFLRQAALSLGRQSPAPAVVGELLSAFRERKLDEFLTRRLITVALTGIMEAREVTRQDVATILQTLPERDALSLLEVWLDYQVPHSPQSDLDTALQLAAQFSPKLDDRLKDELVAMVVRIWGHRAPPLADALLFTTKFERTRVHNRLLSEGARMLAVANPEELQRRMLQFAPVMAREDGHLAAESGMPPAQAFALAKQMQQKHSDAFLRAYVQAFGAEDPRAMSVIAEIHPAKELPDAVAEVVARGLITSGDRRRLATWMDGLAVPAQAKLWDTIAHPSQPPDTPTARAYLQNRPRETPTNVWAMKAVLNALPYDEAMQALPLAGELKGQFRTQIPQEISRNQIRKLLYESPDEVPAFLASIPSEIRHGAIDEALGEWTDPDPKMLQSWIDQADDPSLRAELQTRALENETKHGSVAEAQARLLQLLSNGTSSETYGNIAEKIVAAETDSRRAVSFIQQLPAGKIRDGAIVALTKRWSALDPVAAADWVAELPTGPGRDLATREVISAARDDPERALANAAGIQDPKLRFSAARSVLRVWRDSDPARAEAFIRSAGFPPEETSALRAILGGGSTLTSK